MAAKPRPAKPKIVSAWASPLPGSRSISKSSPANKASATEGLTADQAKLEKFDKVDKSDSKSDTKSDTKSDRSENSPSLGPAAPSASPPVEDLQGKDALNSVMLSAALALGAAGQLPVVLPQISSGTVIRITTALNDVIQGTVLCHAPEASCLILELGPKDYMVVSTSGSALEIIHPAAEDHPPWRPADVSAKESKAREEKAVNQRRRDAARVGMGVTPEAQTICDRLSKTFDCHWDGSTIVLNHGKVRISPPYLPTSVTSQDKRALDYVKQRLVDVRKQMSQEQIQS
jgi:hypothetical protein